MWTDGQLTRGALLRGAARITRKREFGFFLVVAVLAQVQFMTKKLRHKLIP